MYHGILFKIYYLVREFPATGSQIQSLSVSLKGFFSFLTKKHDSQKGIKDLNHESIPKPIKQMIKNFNDQHPLT